MSTPIVPLSLPANDDAAAWLRERAETGLARVRALVEELKAAPPADAEGVLDAWNTIEIELSNVASPAGTFAQLHTLEEVRDAADLVEQDVDRLRTALGLDADLYAVFAALDPAGLDEQAARLLEHTLRDFRRAGVDRDEATRARIAAIAERMVVLAQDFEQHVRDDVRTIAIAPDRLGGLPPEWVEDHPAGPDGLVTVTTDYPDLIPFLTYAVDAAARRELETAYLNRAHPANAPVLTELLALRREHAGLLGYADWADYDAEEKMIGSGPAIGAFIDRITAAAHDSAARDKAVLVERRRRDVPDADDIDAADKAYYAELVRRERFDVDASVVRRYFDFAKVRAGLLEVTGRLFGLDYRDAPEAARWHEDVAVYDVHRADGGAWVGRIHLDLHPREGKFKHAAQFDLVTGVEGVQAPEGVLGCNFGRGLIEHDDVVTLFHEFGHLVHHLLGGHQRWVAFSGVATEWDFVEAPSQMLEEWAWDAAVLAGFATDAEGTPIPADLVARMRTAEDFGKGFDARTQMFYAALSYRLHVEEAPEVTERTRELQGAYSVFPYLPDTHMADSFGHLVGYSSGYYTYMWSLVIAKDMFSAFDGADLFAPEVAARYRDRVLARGGAADAADLVADFLGRPYSFDAFAAWLER